MTKRALVALERVDKVAIVAMASLNPLNPLADDLVDALGEALKTIDADSAIHVSVIVGSARAFAAGADIQAMSKLDYVSAFSRNYIACNWESIRQHRKPLIAAVGGYALGGGCELAMMCDIAIASEDAVFAQPEVSLGIVPGAGGTQRLPRAVGKSMAMEMCLTGRRLSAAEALAAGLVSRVTPNARLRTEALEMARSIASNSLPVLMSIKEAVNRSFESSLSEGLMFERRAFHAGFALEDQKEGMTAFLEKRKPAFAGR
jgi:enoyl-CoA hydratase